MLKKKKTQIQEQLLQALIATMAHLCGPIAKTYRLRVSGLLQPQESRSSLSQSWPNLPGDKQTGEKQLVTVIGRNSQWAAFSTSPRSAFRSELTLRSRSANTAMLKSHDRGLPTRLQGARGMLGIVVFARFPLIDLVLPLKFPEIFPTCWTQETNNNKKIIIVLE